jgi:hypothetical protein
VLVATATALCGWLTQCGDEYDVGGSGDAASEDAPSVPSESGQDADAAAPRCDREKPFGLPAALPYGTFGRPSPDELTLYFSRNTTAGPLAYDIFYATRNVTSAPFSPEATVPGDVNTPSFEARPSVTEDQLSLYYTYIPPDGGAGGVASATRASTGAAWIARGLVGGLFSDAGEDTPYVLPDHHAIYFTSSRSGAGDIYRAVRNGTMFGPPEEVAAVNTPMSEGAAVVTPDELAIYLSVSNGVGAPPDIYVARRTTTADPFGPRRPVVELNTADVDIPTWVSADECVLYLVQGPFAGPILIKVATRPR